ncbi:hypothetical protein EV702DRAFT_1204220 [Suillus placidus]|uniref:Uncharacterized protein n=1 Tax=Suillus placidus TaxID=48579 RepID=A0A9P6ZHU9_9AGAM|nr:hypothetical protein EV702DRAFT_1204220 [Suillus placidus]
MTLLIGHLVIDSSQSSHDSPDSWFIDHFISDAGRHHTLGFGDHIIVYRDFLGPTDPTVLPAFSGMLTHITAWSSTAVEFNVWDAHVGGLHPRTIRIPQGATRLAWVHHLQGRLLFWPRCFHEVSRPPFTLMPKCALPSNVGRERVPHDSDDLPQWDLAHVGGTFYVSSPHSSLF